MSSCLLTLSLAHWGRAWNIIFWPHLTQLSRKENLKEEYHKWINTAFAHILFCRWGVWASNLGPSLSQWIVLYTCRTPTWDVRAHTLRRYRERSLGTWEIIEWDCVKLCTDKNQTKNPCRRCRRDTWVSGSRSSPIQYFCFFNNAFRKRGAPHVMAYWWGPSSIALLPATKTSGGGSASGKPWERLMAPYWFETRVISRITDSVKKVRRSAVLGICSSNKLFWNDFHTH